MGVAGHGMDLEGETTGMLLSFRLRRVTLGRIDNVESFVLVKPKVGNAGGHALGVAASLEGEGMPAGGFVEAKDVMCR